MLYTIGQTLVFCCVDPNWAHLCRCLSINGHAEVHFLPCPVLCCAALVYLPPHTHTTHTVTPPGFYTSGGVTQPCPDHSFRSDWLPFQQAGACTACGSGVQGDKSDRLTVYNLTTGATSLLPIMTSASDCCEWRRRLQISFTCVYVNASGRGGGLRCLLPVSNMGI